jgi:hypothetical protein
MVIVEFDSWAIKDWFYDEIYKNLIFNVSSYGTWIDRFLI